MTTILSDHNSHLLQKAAHGDRAAFERLYAAHHESVRAFLASRLGVVPCDRLDDMVQEVFMRLWRRPDNFRGEARFSTYVMAIARYVLLEEYARRRRQPQQYRTVSAEPRDAARAVEPADIRGVTPKGARRRPEHALEHQEMKAHLGRQVSRLSPRQQEAIALIYNQQLTLPEAASRANCTPQAMRRRVQAAIDRLRRMSAACGRPCGRSLVPTSSRSILRVCSRCLRYLYADAS